MVGGDDLDDNDYFCDVCDDNDNYDDNNDDQDDSANLDEDLVFSA
jgi:hypothetical protein